jgi:hypothetical protein
VRQGQQNRRGRGRNNNRKGGGGHHHNPLSRSFESNGPDVKIRGTPAHIAEKYIALARDAQSSGDPVLAENYLQHAEHYSRIIMAYREQLNQPGEGGMNGNGQRLRGPGDIGEGGDEFGDDEGADQNVDDGFPHAPQSFQQPQSHGHQQRHDNNRHEGNNRHDRPFRHQGRHRDNRDRYNDRGDRDRNGAGDRDRPMEGRPPPQQQDRPPEQQAGEGGDRRAGRDRVQPQHEQPEFLRRPVRRARPETDEPGKDDTSRD